MSGLKAEAAQLLQQLEQVPSCWCRMEQSTNNKPRHSFKNFNRFLNSWLPKSNLKSCNAKTKRINLFRSCKRSCESSRMNWRRRKKIVPTSWNKSPLPWRMTSQVLWTKCLNIQQLVNKKRKSWAKSLKENLLNANNCPATSNKSKNKAVTKSMVSLENWPSRPNGKSKKKKL